MAASGRYKIPRPPLDPWTTREKLALSAAVLRCGDQYWGAVSRAIRPYAEEERPEVYFAPKNCALQYADLLEKVETPKRKRGEKERDSLGTVETPSNMIARRFTIERIEELKQIVEQNQEKYLKMKQKMEEINAGLHDDKLDEMIAAESQKNTEAGPSPAKEPETPQSTAQDPQPMEEDSIPPLPELSSEVLSAELDFANSSLSLTDLLAKSPSDPPIDPAKLDLADALASIKDEPIDIEGDDITLPPIVEQPTEVKVEPKVTEIKQEEQGVTLEPAPSTADTVSHTVIPIPETTEKPAETETKTLDVPTVEKEKEDIVPEKPSLKDQAENKEEEEKEGSVVDAFPDTPSAIKEEPPSSPSSIISCDTDGGSSTRGKGGRSRRPRSARRPDRRRGNIRPRARKPTEEGSKASDMDTSDDDESKNEESDTASTHAPIKSLFLESTPNSPASGGLLFANEEEEKAHKVWKKSIMFVWRAAANHKYANVFSQAVTEDIAPGYHSVVFRPKDLQTIKKDIECGAIRSTPEFQRDMMLMFTNAIMYNNSDHNVFNMATEMYDDVMNHIDQYVLTQLIVKDGTPKGRRGRVDVESAGAAPSPETGGKLLRGSRRSDVAATGSDKEDDKKRRISMDAADHSAGGKAKKRKV